MFTSPLPEPEHLPDVFAAECQFPGSLTLTATHRVTGAVHSFVVTRPFAFVGRMKGMDVRLEDPSVSRGHLYLQVVDGVPHCFDLGSRTGVLWDDGGSRSGPVYPDQTLRLGAYDVRISGGAPRGASPRPDGPEGANPHPFATLEVHSPTGPNGHFALDRPVTLVGRHPNCGLRFLDPGTAYFQCALVVTPTGVWCVDLLSLKGTLVNARSTRLGRLRDGDLIELGKIGLVLRGGDPRDRPLALAHQHGPVAVPASVRTGTADPVEASAAPLAPFREMLAQFQQCFVNMVQIMTAMQQEHTAMMCEQMRQVQELMLELRGAPKPEPALPTGPAAPAAPRVPTPKVAQGPDVDALTDAHGWFLDRLAKRGQAPAPK